MDIFYLNNAVFLMRDALTTGVRIDLLESYTTQLKKRVKNLSRLIAKKKRKKKKAQPKEGV